MTTAVRGRMKKRVAIGLDPDVEEKARQFCEKRGISMSSLVQRALLHYFECPYLKGILTESSPPSDEEAQSK